MLSIFEQRLEVRGKLKALQDFRDLIMSKEFNISKNKELLECVYLSFEMTDKYLNELKVISCED